MKYNAAILAAAVLAITPAAAQQHQESHPSAHPAPAVHAAPAPAMHATHPSTHTHPVVHHATTHPTAHHHMTTHHVRHVSSHHHAVVHHVVRATTRSGFHRASPAAVAKLRRNVVAVHRFHAGPYRAPPGWHYRRWVFGERLPGIYFAPAFWISDFIAFDLFPPPDGFVWVRFGPDALLIDRYTGEIIQVDYGVFF